MAGEAAGLKSNTKIRYIQASNEFLVTRPNGVQYRYQSVGALAGDTSTSGPQYQMAQQNRWVLTEIRNSQKDGSGALAVVMTLQRRSVSLPCGRTEREDQFDNITSAGDNEAVGSARNCASMPCDPNASSPDTKQTKLNIYQIGTGNDQPIATIISSACPGGNVRRQFPPVYIQKNLNQNPEFWAEKFEGKAISDIGLATAQLISVPEAVYRHSCQRRDIWMAPAGTPGRGGQGIFPDRFPHPTRISLTTGQRCQDQ